MEIAVAMSGGVDSTVAAALLRDAGYRVVGVSMVSWRGSLCCSFEDVARARLMARRLGIRHYLIDLMEAFRDQVITPYVEARLQGLSPNPCPACNRNLKFGKMWQALRLRTRADLLASGHYVRLVSDALSGRPALARARENARDQSYMLWQLSQEQLRQMRFPLGEMRKADVRALAQELGLPEVAARPDSQDLCFLVPDQAAFWQAQAEGRYAPGEIVDAQGQVLGRHKGLVHYTPGQRRGLGVAVGERLYVQSICAQANRLRVGPARPDGPCRLRLEALNWMAAAPMTSLPHCQAQLRLHGRLYPASLQPAPDGLSAEVELEAGPAIVAPGQSLVCYGPDGEVLLGGVIAALSH